MWPVPMKTGQAYPSLTYGAGAYRPYETIVAEAVTAAIGIAGARGSAPVEGGDLRRDGHLIG